jgi:hypothetical protein
MKKILLAAAVLSFTLVSCKKDYTCSCTATDLPANFKSFEYGKTKKKDAESTCDTQESQLKTAGYTDASCSI